MFWQCLNYFSISFRMSRCYPCKFCSNWIFFVFLPYLVFSKDKHSFKNSKKKKSFCIMLSEKLSLEWVWVSNSYCMIPFLWHFGKSKIQEQRTDKWLPGVWSEGSIWIERGSWKVFFRILKLFCILSMVVIISIRVCVKTYKTVHQKMNFAKFLIGLEIILVPIL